MRIGVLTTSFPRTPDDISGLFVLGFCKALAARGHTLEVLAPEPSERIAAPTHAGIETHFVPYLRPRSLQRTFYGAGVPDNLRRDVRAHLGLLPFPLALARACATHVRHWDALISHWALPSALVAGLLRADRPHLAVLHSADVHLLERLPMRARAARHILEHATALWFVAPQHRDRFAALLSEPQRRCVAEKTFVSPMGIEPPVACDRESARTALSLRNFSVLVLGRLLPIKAVDVAIEAAKHSQVTLLIAGDGPERATLERLAAARGTDARFLGTVTGTAKARLFTAADAFVAPSRVLPNGRTEGVPTALLEAMSYGLPVVATATGGMPSALDDRVSGLLVPPDDPRALSDALTCLRDDMALRTTLGRRAGAFAAGLHWSELGRKAELLLCEGPPKRGATPVSVA